MAENFLKEIYREAVLRTELKFLIEQFAGGSDGKERDNFQQVIKELETVSVKYAAMNPKDGGELLNALRKIQEYDGKYLEMADYLESDILPLYENYLRQLHKICVEDGQGYCLESSLYGFLTIRDTKNGRYFHSRNDPMWEAAQIARRIYDPSMKSYSLLGCGLGYVAYQLYCFSDGSVPINIFEYDDTGRMPQYHR